MAQILRIDWKLLVIAALIHFRRAWQNHRVGNVSRAKCGTSL